MITLLRPSVVYYSFSQQWGFAPVELAPGVSFLYSTCILVVRTCA
jgi:hypothetical protein